jgi:hypothetical protein
MVKIGTCELRLPCLRPCLDRNTFVASERGHGGSITGTKDASCCILMEKMISPKKAVCWLDEMQRLTGSLG